MDLESNVIVSGPGAQIVEVAAATRLDSAISAICRDARTWAESDRGAVAMRGGVWSIGGYVATQLLRTVPQRRCWRDTFWGLKHLGW